MVTEVGPDITDLAPGDRVVIPFNISCGHCWMCTRGLYAQCETTQVRDQGKGAALFGYTSLYGSVPGGQAELLRVPQAQFGPIKVPADGPDEQYLFLSDILPTAYQAVTYAETPKDGTLAVLGLGPVGQLAARIARHLGVERVIGVDPVPDRRAAAARFGIEAVCPDQAPDTASMLIEMTSGRGPDAVIDAVGMEAHGYGERAASKVAETAQRAVGLLPDRLAAKITDVGHRPAGGPAHRGQGGPPRRHRLGQRRLRRRGRSHADDGDVRPRRPAPHGPGSRQAVDRGPHAHRHRRP